MIGSAGRMWCQGNIFGTIWPTIFYRKKYKTLIAIAQVSRLIGLKSIQILADVFFLMLRFALFLWIRYSVTFPSQSVANPMMRKSYAVTCLKKSGKVRHQKSKFANIWIPS